jgi:hypothetical protein
MHILSQKIVELLHSQAKSLHISLDQLQQPSQDPMLGFWNLHTKTIQWLQV